MMECIKGNFWKGVGKNFVGWKEKVLKREC